MADKINIKQKLAELEKLEAKLLALGADFDAAAGGRTTSEHIELANEWGKVKNLRERLFLLDQSIDIDENSLTNADKYSISEETQERLRQQIERNTKRAESIAKASTRTINAATTVYETLKPQLGSQPMVNDPEPEEEKPKKELPKKPPIPEPEKTKQQEHIEKVIESSVERFNRKVPVLQKETLAVIEEELRKLDLQSGNIKATVKNLSVIANLKNRLGNVILTDDYKSEVKEFAGAFKKITDLQNNLWKQVESTFKPSALLAEIRNISIEDVVTKLLDTGINANIADPIADVLRTNITTGGSYSALTDQLRQLLTDTNTQGLLSKYAKTLTTDSLNSYNAQYTQTVSSDLGFSWFKYSGSDITTTRPFCDAMTDRPYFHISETPALLRAEGLTYVNKKGERVPVPIYSRTGLPHGMKENTTAENFLINRGGWNCGHQCRPVSESLVPQADKDRAYSTPAYIRWKAQQRVAV